jgi:hypothetical protein
MREFTSQPWAASFDSVEPGGYKPPAAEQK